MRIPVWMRNTTFVPDLITNPLNPLDAMAHPSQILTPAGNFLMTCGKRLGRRLDCGAVVLSQRVSLILTDSFFS